MGIDPGTSYSLSVGKVFCQVGGGAGAVMDTTSHIEGMILSKTAIVMNTGASCNGRLYAQTAVTLDQSQVVNPLVSDSYVRFPLSIQALTGEQMLLEVADSTPGNTYWIEYKNSLLEGRWIMASEFLTAITNLTQWIDSGPLVEKRFYRALELSP